ncbi:MAG: HAMP domain-containing histidine kinase [Candidatus Omnitrophica bacterium]|jgi:signal transduction histidine kinase|nr:HAMP domain-containing histidine kinase [Candidatus Omnitrophota bacterium]
MGKVDFINNKRIEIYAYIVVASSVILGVIALWMLTRQYQIISYVLNESGKAFFIRENIGSYTKISTLAFSLIIFALVLIMATGSYLSSQDIQRQMEISKLKNNFVSTVSHELKTPLTAIRLLAERLVNNPQEADKQSQYHLHILQQSYYLSSLISNILDFSKAENKKENLCFEETDIGQLTQKAIQEYPASLIRPDCRLEINFKDIGHKIKLDKESFTRAFINILDNALKFSPASGKITINLSAQGQGATIEIIDQGDGIPKDEQKKIFDPFYHKGKGTGLGLTLAKNFIEKNHGEITVENQIPRGVKFTITIP